MMPDFQVTLRTLHPKQATIVERSGKDVNPPDFWMGFQDVFGMRREKLEILNRVIAWVAIYMMDNFVFCKVAT
jgi:hypothetical protein